MIYRKLGKTELNVCPIGIGTEHLNRHSQKRISSVLACAVEQGFNYFDILTASPKARDKYGIALQGLRDKVLIAGHLVKSSREPAEAEAMFYDLLTRLRTDYVDVLFIQFVDKDDDYEKIMKPKGLYTLADRLRRDGKARYIGISGHKIPVALKAVNGGLFDVIMHPVNLASKAISTPFRRGFVNEEKKLFMQDCAKNRVGLIAIKTLWGGKLLKQGESYTATPVQCIHYALSQVGVDMALPGVSTIDEVTALTRYFEATKDEKDYSSILRAQSKSERIIEGCVYCNHCLPCPAGIDIALINKFYDIATQGLTKELRSAYKKTSPKASDCTECGGCTERCPFGVDPASRMRKAREIFG